MSELAKTYEPNAVEAKWYAYWLEHGCFQADPARVSAQRPAYSIVIPPPNVTGVLTLGHVLNNTIQDILARRARMLGKEVLWLPGMDHAGIATQNVVEKTLRKAGEMKHRDDLGREALVAKIWEWKEKYGGIIIQQLKKLGASCDWSRERFTMDPEYSKCVSRVFVDLYKKGLIYRGKRMVNWSPASLTALSDEEVIMKETNGWLYHFSVPVVEADGSHVWEKKTEDEEQAVFLQIATTRPETIPGDVAIAVNPKDERYTAYVGKFAIRPLPAALPEEKKLIPIIADEHVDMAYGTGVLKVTPFHDKADYEIARRHRLQCDREVIGPDGKMTSLAGELAGLDRFEARNQAHALLLEITKAKGGHWGARTHPYNIPVQNNIGYSERADEPIEPRLSEQWFLKYPSVDRSQAVVATGTMKFFPERWVKVYDYWLSGIEDWCISRQLWWGHRIPVWYKEISNASAELPDAFIKAAGDAWLNFDEGFSFSVSGSDGETYLRREKLSTGRGCLLCASTISASEIRALERLGFTQDPDVLDTWFSSWLWPFATMGWPEKTETLAKFYPTTDLVTGPDIIFFWVARMIMAGFEFMGELPFRNVYFTGIIRDKQGRKMSKSLGNSPDPLDLIAKYGADALRFGVMRSAPLGSDILFDEKNVELGRNFCTKLWNATRFRQMQGGASEREIQPALLTSDDKWILLCLDSAIEEISAALDAYRFSDATNTLYRFFWSEFCDWYLEVSKVAFNSGNAGLRANTLAVLDFVFAHLLRLMHPFLPFITEELWHALGFNDDLPKDQGGETVMFAHWPTPLGEDFKSNYRLGDSDKEFVQEKRALVNAGRKLRSDANIPAHNRVRFLLWHRKESLQVHDIAILKSFLNAETIDEVADEPPQKQTASVMTSLGVLILPLEGLINVAAERERLAKEIAKVEQELAKVRAKLADPNFTGKVPAKVLDEHRQREQDWAEKHAQLVKMREALGAA